MNYEKFTNSEYGLNLDWATNIETVAATSLGVDGWALHDVGTLEEERSSSSTSSTSWLQQAHGIFERSGEAGAAGGAAGSVPLRVISQGSTRRHWPEDTCMTSIVGGLGFARLGASEVEHSS